MGTKEMTRTQFHRAAKHKNLLSTHEIFDFIKTGFPTKFPRDFSGFVSKQQLNTSNRQYASNSNFVGNPVFIKEEISC